jgi:hypothetical protein
MELVFAGLASKARKAVVDSVNDTVTKRKKKKKKQHIIHYACY